VRCELIVKLAVVHAEPPLRALADVTLSLSASRITIFRCPVFERPGQAPWTSLPRLVIPNVSKRYFVPLVSLSADLEKRIFSVVLSEYRRVTCMR
jgi:hypothetical protein